MAYRADSAAYAYDMYDVQPQAYPDYEAQVPAAPASRTRPRFDVVTGEGLEANQAVSPMFTHAVKLFCLAIALVFAVGCVRIGIAQITTSQLNANATLSSTLESAHAESSDLQVLRSAYSSETRIRELATDTLGMVSPEGEGTTLDFNSDSSSSSTDASASAQTATDVPSAE